MNRERLKQKAATQAMQYIQDHMIIGLGSGSTVYYFIKQLSERCRQGLKIQAGASSLHSTHLAKEGGIPLIDMHQVTRFDITVDGADEIDREKRMIKGGGGALLREKILASNSDEMIVIVDETKVVNQLGACKLPLEILPFGNAATILCLTNKGFQGKMRVGEHNQLMRTDNGNYIYDIDISQCPAQPEDIEKQLITIPGVLETGFFFNLAGRVIIGKPDAIEIWPSTPSKTT